MRSWPPAYSSVHGSTGPERTLSRPSLICHESPEPVRSNAPVLNTTAAGSGSPSSRARRISAAARLPPADVPPTMISLGSALVQEHPVCRKAVVERRGERVVGRHPVVHRPGTNSDGVGRGDRGPLAQLATTENPGAAVDVEEHSGVVVRYTVRRDDVEGARPDVAFLDAACEPGGRITHHRAHETVGLGDVGLPAFGVIERRQFPCRRTEPAHRQHRLGLLAHRAGDRDLS